MAKKFDLKIMEGIEKLRKFIKYKKRQKFDLETREGIEELKKIKNYIRRQNMIKKNPEIILYASQYWHEETDKYKKLVYKALMLKPDMILNFNDKNGLITNKATISIAVLSEPMLVAKMSPELKKMIDINLFVDIFKKNPLILTVTDLPVLKETISLEAEVIENGKKVTKRFNSNLRDECLKAIRLFDKISDYHEGYDDFAKDIADSLQNSKEYKAKRFTNELLKCCATLMNVLIKKEKQSLRICNAEQWLVNKGKPAYFAVRVASGKNSQLKGLLGDMPTNKFPEKMVKKLVITAVRANPEEYFKLKNYGLGEYVDDKRVKYELFKTLKAQNILKDAEKYLSKEEILKIKKKEIVKIIKTEVLPKSTAYTKLEDYGFGEFANNNAIKRKLYNVLKEKNMLNEAKYYLSKEDIEKFQKKDAILKTRMEIIEKITNDPTYYLKLKQSSLKEFAKDKTIKNKLYIVLMEKNMLQDAGKYLSQKDIEGFKEKYAKTEEQEQVAQQ